MKVKGTLKHDYNTDTVFQIIRRATEPGSDITREDLLRVLENANCVVLTLRTNIEDATRQTRNAIDRLNGIHHHE